MVVCICNRYRDAEIRAAARTGMTSAHEIYQALGNPPRCGRCLEFAAEVIEEVHASGAAPINALATTGS